MDRIVPEVRSGGARNIVELASALKIPVETTRYKVKGMLRRGLDIHASVDYNKFGLTHHYAYFDLSERARTSEKKFFKLLADHGYLTSYARILPSNEFACKFAFPKYSSGSLTRLLRGLSEEKLIENAEIHDVTWEKNHMIQPEFFDLKKGTWRIDWTKMKKETLVQKEPKQDGHTEFDELDLMIARELEVDALARLSDIADSLKTTLNNVFYHFHKHILEGKLVEEFVIRWSGNAKLPTVFAQFQFTNLSVVEEKVVRAALRRAPYLWTDALSIDTGFYLAQAMLPQDQYIEMMYYLSSTLGTASRKLKIHLLDSRTRQDYPLPSQLYMDGKWSYDTEESIQHITSRLRK